jgi:hypothetical protein
VIGGVSPANGGTSGGTAITIGGANFQAGATVTVGGVPLTSVVVNPTIITGVTGAYALPAGTLTTGVDVFVANPDGTTGTLVSGFTYQLRPGPVSAGTTPGANPDPRAGGANGQVPSLPPSRIAAVAVSPSSGPTTTHFVYTASGLNPGSQIRFRVFQGVNVYFDLMITADGSGTAGGYVNNPSLFGVTGLYTLLLSEPTSGNVIASTTFTVT